MLRRAARDARPSGTLAHVVHLQVEAPELVGFFAGVDRLSPSPAIRRSVASALDAGAGAVRYDRA